MDEQRPIPDPNNPDHLYLLIRRRRKHIFDSEGWDELAAAAFIQVSSTLKDHKTGKLVAAGADEAGRDAMFGAFYRYALSQFICDYLEAMYKEWKERRESPEQVDNQAEAVPDALENLARALWKDQGAMLGKAKAQREKNEMEFQEQLRHALPGLNDEQIEQCFSAYTNDINQKLARQYYNKRVNNAENEAAGIIARLKEAPGKKIPEGHIGDMRKRLKPLVDAWYTMSMAPEAEKQSCKKAYDRCQDSLADAMNAAGMGKTQVNLALQSIRTAIANILLSEPGKG